MTDNSEAQKIYEQVCLKAFHEYLRKDHILWLEYLAKIEAATKFRGENDGQISGP